MNITHALTLFTALAFAAGCAHEEHPVRYENNSAVSPTYSSGRMSDYNSKNDSSGATFNNGTASNTDSPGSTRIAGGESDSEVIADVRESLARDPEIAMILPNIQISVNNGAVLLNGSAQGEAQKRQITSIVQRAPGVVVVNNQLKVPAAPNENGNAGGPELNPTGNAAAQSLYKTPAQGEGNNNALNPGSMQNGQGQVHQQNTPVNNQPDQQTNSNSLNPTSRSDTESHIYNERSNGQGMNNIPATGAATPTQNTGGIQYTNPNNQKP